MFCFNLTTRRTISDHTPRINGKITARNVRLINADGSQLGIVPLARALQIAEQQNLDLVEVAADANPPVCRIKDYGKERFEQEKAAKGRKDTTPAPKELRVGYAIGAHDLDTKLRQAREFLTKGHRVTFVMQFKARQNQYQSQGLVVLADIADRLKDVGKIERAPFAEGKRAQLVISAAQK